MRKHHYLAVKVVQNMLFTVETYATLHVDIIKLIGVAQTYIKKWWYDPPKIVNNLTVGWSNVFGETLAGVSSLLLYNKNKKGFTILLFLLYSKKCLNKKKDY